MSIAPGSNLQVPWLWFLFPWELFGRLCQRPSCRTEEFGEESSRVNKSVSNVKHVAIQTATCHYKIQLSECFAEIFSWILHSCAFPDPLTATIGRPCRTLKMFSTALSRARRYSSVSASVMGGRRELWAIQSA